MTHQNNPTAPSESSAFPSRINIRHSVRVVLGHTALVDLLPNIIKPSVTGQPVGIDLQLFQFVSCGFFGAVGDVRHKQIASRKKSIIVLHPKETNKKIPIFEWLEGDGGIFSAPAPGERELRKKPLSCCLDCG